MHDNYRPPEKEIKQALIDRWTEKCREKDKGTK